MYIHDTKSQYLKFSKHTSSDRRSSCLRQYFKYKTSVPTNIIALPQSPDPQWTAWGSWSSCSVTCGLGCVTRVRACVDVASPDGLAPVENSAGLACPGPDKHDNDCDAGMCPGLQNICRWKSRCNSCNYKFLLQVIIAQPGFFTWFL